jgi:hypothetical protein
MSARHYVLAAAATVASMPFALAAELNTVDVTREGERYHLLANAELDAPAAAVYQVLLDYEDDRFGRISDIYKESAYLAPASDGTPLVYTHVEGCLLFFCRSMRRVERLEVIEPRFIRTTTIPERSDFKYSESEWELEPNGAATTITYHLSIEPDFWLPPFVGPWFLKRTLSRGGIDAVQRIEELAQQEDSHTAGASRTVASQ